MPSFTEYVHLIAEGNEAIAVINKINEAIAKMRREASQPINVKINPENEKQANSHRQQRTERLSADQKELELLRKKKEEIAAIKAMNKEVGNPSFNIRYGNQESIAQNQRYSEQLAETTRRINRIADAHKHVAAVAKQADVEVSKSLAERLATQTATRSEKDEAQSIREAAKAAAEREKQMAYGLTRDMQIKTEALREQERIEKSIAAANKQRLNEELTGERIVLQMKKEEERVAEKERREQRQAQAAAERAEAKARRERETQIASYRESGIRGLAGEWQRDIRRNLTYGVINKGEQLIHQGYEADVERDTAIENVRQAGRTQQEINQMIANAKKLSLQNPTLTASEMLTMQQHNIGAFGSFQEGVANNQLSARYLATRKGKVGEDEALKENLSILKVGEETGRIRDAGFMKKLYDQQLKIAQAEGAQYDPASLLTSVRMLKSSKFGLSDDAMLNLLPFMGMSEGAARIGNQIAMLSKSMTYAGKSLSKQNLAEISGTAFSNGKDGYNQDIQTKFAAGDMTGVAAIVDTYLKQKGFNPDDKSNANINKEMQQIAKAIGNTSAREALTAIWANKDQFEKQQRMAAGAQGLGVAGLAPRTLQGAMDATSAQYKNMSADVLAPFNPLMIRVMNGVARVEELVSKSASSGNVFASTAGLGAAGLFAAFKMAQENPAQAALTASLAANTIATASNTAATAASTGKGLLGGAAGAAEGGLGLLAARLTAIGTTAYAGYLAVDDVKKWWELHKLATAAQTPEGIANYNKQTISDDEAAVKFAQAQADAHAKLMQQQMNGVTPPKGAVDIIGKQIADALKAATDKLNADKGSPLHFKKDVKDAINSGKFDDDHVAPTGTVDPRQGRGYGRKYQGSPSFHSSYYTTGEQFGPPQENARDKAERTFIGPQMTAQQSFDAQFPKLAASSATTALASIHSAGTEMAGALTSAGDQVKGGAGAAAGSIQAGGEAIAGALSVVAGAISAAASKIGAQGAPQVAPQSTGASPRGPR